MLDDHDAADKKPIGEDDKSSRKVKVMDIFH